jgi:hypothetical protein
MSARADRTPSRLRERVRSRLGGAACAAILLLWAFFSETKPEHYLD